MPEPPNTRRPAAVAPTSRPAAPDPIDEATRTFKAVLAALALAKQAQRMPADSPRGLRMLERAIRMLELLDRMSSARPRG